MRKIDVAAWLVYYFSLVVVFFFFAWQIHLVFDFFYSFWYEVLGLGDAIAKYGPLNYHKPNFHLLSKLEHAQAFSDIVAAISSGGEGLRNIEYRWAGELKARLLTEAEAVHLQDVANLISIFYWSAALSFVYCALWLGISNKLAIKKPKLRQLMILFLSILAVTAGLIVVVGAKALFYQLHIWVFPDNHQWFFYYQESLMSTMMRAPDLFGGLAVSLAIMTGGLLLIWTLIQKKVEPRSVYYN